MQGLGNILNALGGLTGPVRFQYHKIHVFSFTKCFQTTLSLGSILGELGSAPGGVGGVWPTVVSLLSEIC